MRLLPMLLGLVFPACGQEGVDGLPVPPPMDITRIERPASPNTALAAPEGFSPTPDVVTHFKADPARLYAAIRAVAARQERVFLHAVYDEARQAHYVARSAQANYPDLITVQATPEGGLVMWSRSVYGRRDFGVNAERVAAWVAAIGAELARN